MDTEQLNDQDVYEMVAAAEAEQSQLFGVYDEVEERYREASQQLIGGFYTLTASASTTSAYTASE